MSDIVLILALVGLFFVLGQGASWLLDNLCRILRGSHISPLLVGLILGFLTTLPELIVGFNAIKQGIPGVSLGNLLGGLMVILGLVLGVGILFNEQMKDARQSGILWHNLVFIFLPFVMALKGYICWLDGVAILTVYLSLILSIYYCNKDISYHETHHLVLGKSLKEVENKLRPWLMVLIGIISVLAASKLIVEVAEIFLLRWGFEEVLVGLIIFSLGTNLPELIVAIKAGLSKNGGIALNHVLGSAAANVLILGILSLFTTFKIILNFNFWITLIGVAFLLIMFGWFYTRQRRLSRLEGLIFLIIYLLFVVAQFFKL